METNKLGMDEHDYFNFLLVITNIASYILPIYYIINFLILYVSGYSTVKLKHIAYFKSSIQIFFFL